MAEGVAARLHGHGPAGRLDFVGTGIEYNREAGVDAGSVTETISGHDYNVNNTLTFKAFQGSGGQTSYT